MKVKCFTTPSFCDVTGKLILNEVEVSLTIETPGCFGHHAFVVKRLNKKLDMGVGRRSPDGYQYHTCDFNPLEEFLEKKDRAVNPSGYKYPPFFHFFETAEDSIEYLTYILEKDTREHEEKLTLLQERIKANKAKLNKIKESPNR